MSGRDHQQTGQWAEAESEKFLRAQGLKFLARNFRCRRGEIDLIMTDGEALVFIEVRYRRSPRFGTGLESVTASKRRRLFAAARFFLAQGNTNPSSPCRFDVISVTRRNYRPEFQWVRNAFTQDG